MRWSRKWLFHNIDSASEFSSKLWIFSITLTNKDFLAWARQTHRAIKELTSIGVALGGNPGAILVLNNKRAVMNLVFEKKTKNGFQIALVRANNNNFSSLNGSLTGEGCTTPEYIILKNLFQMIDDLPLDGLEKAYLKERLDVYKARNLSLF